MLFRSHAPGLPLLQTIALFFRNPVLALTALSAGLTAFVGYALLNWSPSYLIRVRHMSREEIALYYSLLVGLSGAAGTFGSGWLVDTLGRMNRRAYALVPMGCVAVSLPFFMLYASAPNWPLALLCLAIPALLLNGYLAPALAVVQNAVPPAQRGTASALLLFILNLIGLGGGPVFVGWLSDRFKPAYGTASLQMAFYGLAPFFVLCVLSHYAASRAIGRDARLAAAR